MATEAELAPPLFTIFEPHTDAPVLPPFTPDGTDIALAPSASPPGQSQIDMHHLASPPTIRAKDRHRIGIRANVLPENAGVGMLGSGMASARSSSLGT